MAPITLYHFGPSAPSRGALLAIRNLDLDVNIQTLNLFKKDQLSEDFVKINPQHTVPTLDDNGFVLWESRAIAGYLVDSRSPGNSLYPTDPKKRALINQRLYFDAGTLYTRVRAIGFPTLFLGETKVSEEKRKQLYDAFNLLEGFLEGHDWVAGDDLSIADLAILASLSSIVYAGADLSSYKNLSAWYQRMKIVPGYAENDAGAKIWGDKVKSLLTDSI